MSGCRLLNVVYCMANICKKHLYSKIFNICYNIINYSCCNMHFYLTFAVAFSANDIQNLLEKKFVFPANEIILCVLRQRSQTRNPIMLIIESRFLCLRCDLQHVNFSIGYRQFDFYRQTHTFFRCTHTFLIQCRLQLLHDLTMWCLLSVPVSNRK